VLEQLGSTVIDNRRENQNSTQMSKVLAGLEAKGIRPGPESFKGWNDGDAGFVRAIWCLVRQLRPQIARTTEPIGTTLNRCTFMSAWPGKQSPSRLLQARRRMAAAHGPMPGFAMPMTYPYGITLDRPWTEWATNCGISPTVVAAVPLISDWCAPRRCHRQ
jgi:hypothetical protein